MSRNTKTTHVLSIILVSTFLASSLGASADPVLTDNGNGTTTALWDFQNPANYMSQNLSITPGNVTLLTSSGTFVDTTQTDFQQGAMILNMDIASDPGNMTMFNTTGKGPLQLLNESISTIGGKDAYINRGSKNRNYGASATLNSEPVDQKRMLVEFNVSGFNSSFVITSAELMLRLVSVGSAQPLNISIHQLYESWTEGTKDGGTPADGVSYNTRDGSVSWTISGGFYDNMPEDTVDAIRDYVGWYTWNITQLFRDWIEGLAPNYGVILVAEETGSPVNEKMFASKEFGVTSYHPRLRVLYNSSGPGTASSSFISRTFDAGMNVKWTNISWNATVPSQTNMSIQTRSGDCLGSWSSWSSSYTTPAGSGVASPDNRCLQYRIDMATDNESRTPTLEEVVVRYWAHLPDGFIGTEDLQPINLISWDVFDTSSALPAGTSITYSYSTNSGTSWIPVLPGTNLFLVASPKIRFRAYVTTSDPSLTPTLVNMSIIYVHIGPLDHIHMSQPIWNGTTDDIVDLNATGHDVLHNSVGFTPYWSTTDPTGTVDGNGTYSPGTVGTWRLYCNNSDNSISNYTIVNVTIGALASIDVSPDTVIVVVGGIQSFNAQGYDGDGNSYSLSSTSWSTNAGTLSGITPVAANLTAQATPLVGGWISASESGITGSAVVEVIAGPLDHIHMSASAWIGTIDDMVDLDATGHDMFDNLVTFTQFWSTTDPTGTVDANGTYDPDSVGTWRIYCNNSDDSIANYTTVNVTVGSLVSIVVTPDPVTLIVGDVQTFNALGFDSGGNSVGLTNTTWSTNAGTISNATSPTADLNAQFTPLLGGWINATEGGLTGTAVVDIIEGPLDHIHISQSTWTGTTDEVLDLNATGHDAFDNLVSFTQFWSTTDPTGTVDANGTYDPGIVGTWLVYCNNSDDSVSNYMTVNVLPGTVYRIAVDPWDPGTLTTDDILTLSVTAYDIKGNPLGPVLANWTVNGGIGSVTSGPLSTVTFDPITPGVGTITADGGMGHTNTTNTITVIIGIACRVGIQPWSPGTLTADDSINFTAFSYDADDNVIGTASVTWSVSGGIGTIQAGPSDTSLFEATTVGAGMVSIDDGAGHTNTTNVIQVVPGSRYRVGITPWSPGTLTTDESLLFSASAYDADGNLIGPASVSWSISGGIGDIALGPAESSPFDATTPGTGNVSINDGLGHTNITDTITVVAGALARIEITPNPVVVEHLEYQDFIATGYDADGNVVLISESLWETNAGSIAYSAAQNATLLAQGTSLLNGWVRVTATTQGNATGSSVVSVAVTNVNPVIQGTIPNQVRPEDYGSWSIDLSSYASDAQDPLSGLTWFFTNHDTTLTTISGDNVAGNHLVTVTTQTNAYGSDQLTIWLRDTDGNVDSQAMYINITSVNDRPVIQSIAPFTIHYDHPYSYYFYDYVSDVETTKQDLMLTSDDPAHISINGLWATFTYPASLLDSTVYPVITVHDEHGGQMSTVLAITVSDDYAPELVNELPDVTMFEGEEVLAYFDLDDYFEDPDGDSLFYTVGNVNVDITINTDHTVDFIALADWSGQEIVTFRAIDPSNARAEDIVLITVLPINDAPLITGVPDLVVHFDDPARPDYNYTFDLAPYIHDVDNDVSELSIGTNDTAHILFWGPNTLMYLHYPMNMNGQTIAVRITVSDGNLSTYDDILVTVLDNWGPEVNSTIPGVVFYEDLGIADFFAIDDYFTDPESDQLSYSVLCINVIVTIDPSTFLVSFSSLQDWFGEEYVIFRATDTYGAIVEQIVRVTVLPVNDAPVVLAIPEITIHVGQTLALDLTDYVHDIDNAFSDLILRATGNYSGVPYVAGSFLVFDYSESGKDVVLLEVTDGDLTTYSIIVVTIVSSEPPPSVWDLVNWPWWIVIILLVALLAVAVTRRFLSQIDIREAFLIHQDGNLISHAAFKGTEKTDKSMFSDAFSIIQDFIRESFKEVEEAPVKKIEFGSQKIAVESGENVFLGIVYTGHESERNLQPMREAIEEIERIYGIQLQIFDESADLSGLGIILEKHLGK